MADADDATALVIEKIANSPFKDNTLIFVIEDNAQNGGDHRRLGPCSALYRRFLTLPWNHCASSPPSARIMP